jgi:hypothetical protein
MRTVLLVLLLSSCGSSKPAVSDVRMVMLPAKPSDCPLELVAVQPADMMPGARFGAGAGLSMIGAVTLGLDEGTDVMSEAVRALVRPRACAMGGEVVSLLASGTAGHYQISGSMIRTTAQTDAAFTVWAHVPAAGPGPEKF